MPAKKFEYNCVGILGGMGAAASANFLRRFTAEFAKRGAREDNEFPRIVTLNLPLEGWSHQGAVDKAAVAAQVREGVRWLDRAGAEIIAVPCNSVHEFYDDFSRLGVTVMHIIDETLRGLSGSIRGVLCSQQTRNAGLYERAETAIRYPESQDIVDRAIASVISGHPISLEYAAMELAASGAEVVILGCTELSLCPKIRILPTADSTKKLARALADVVLGSER